MLFRLLVLVGAVQCSQGCALFVGGAVVRHDGSAVGGTDSRGGGIHELDRDARWAEDLRVLVAELPKRHVDFFKTLNRATFDKAAAALQGEIPELVDHEIIVRMAQLVALAGDGHTRLNPLEKRAGFHVFPVTFYWFADGIRVVGAPTSRRRLLGARLLRIDGHTVAEATARAASVVGHENDAMVKLSAPRCLSSAEVLHALGITRTRHRATYTMVLVGGKKVEESFKAEVPKARKDWWTVTNLPGYKPPLHQRSRKKLYSAKYLRDSRTLLVMYNKCRQDPKLSFRSFVITLFRRSRGLVVDRLVVDLRHNGGGNSAIARPLINRIKKDNRFKQPGRLFVIVGRETFSSGLWNAIQLRDECGAIVVGEPTGGKPNHFGEVKTFKLPHCDYTVAYSTRYWNLVPGDDSASLNPEVTALLTWDALAAGRDDALRACIAWESHSGPGEKGGPGSNHGRGPGR